MVTRRACIAQIGSVLGAAAMGRICPLFAAPQAPEQTARFWHREGSGIIMCELCPHGCALPEGKTGICRNRVHRGGRLVALGYARPCAVHVDPIEKKPLYHMLPGARTYSLGVAGCNMRCKNCQNYTISQRSPLETENVYLPPERVVEEAINERCTVVAFTYTEPSVWLEYVIDTATAARKAGLKTALVSSGYINPAPFEELCNVLDAARIDLKSFSDATYHNLNAGKLQPVLDTLLLARKRRVWLEVINLVIPGWNDTPEELRALSRWVKNRLGAETPLHFSRFYPMYQLSNIYPTPVATLNKAAAIASGEGLSYVYIGNVAGIGGTTTCPKCGKVIVERSGYTITVNKINNGKCGFCGSVIPGLWG
ncbi:MAG: AmmeMemoRadiSam system radical SAM enzyme [Chitinispirillaceae bacterium]|nr:AmmeMemoRadiSam system radical SAM enzyme [Chitinispirillaceae bacterium]